MSLREQIESELAKCKARTVALEKVLAVLDDPDASAFLNGEVQLTAPVPALAGALAEADNGKKPRKVVNTGRRKAILMALHTGPATEQDLRRALVWSSDVVHGVLVDTARAGLVAEDPNRNIWTLTTNGIQHVKFFLAHPNATTYKPWLYLPRPQV